MGFKSYVSGAWGAAKRGVTKVTGKLKDYGTAINDKWTKRIQPWIQNTLGEDATDMLAGIGGQLLGAGLGGLAGAAASAIPKVGPMIAPIATNMASKFVGKKTADKISPGLAARVESEKGRDYKKKETVNTLKDIFDGKDVPEKKGGYKITAEGKVESPPRKQNDNVDYGFFDKNLKQNWTKEAIYTRATKAKSGRMKLSQAHRPSGFGGTIFDLANGWLSRDNRFGTPSVYGGNRG